ncbi:hypothetical protein C8F01DRAFT_1234127, partial [Mycena amicta]
MRLVPLSLVVAAAALPARHITGNLTIDAASYSSVQGTQSLRQHLNAGSTPTRTEKQKRAQGTVLLCQDAGFSGYLLRPHQRRRALRRRRESRVGPRQPASRVLDQMRGRSVSCTSTFSPIRLSKVVRCRSMTRCFRT